MDESEGNIPPTRAADTPRKGKALSSVAISKARPKDKPYKLADEKGLFLLIHSNGGKYWRLKYRYDGKEKILALGVYPDVSLADARSRRDDARRLLANGIDPGIAKKQGALSVKESSLNSFEAIAREWMVKHLADRAPGHKQTVVDRLERNVFPWIGSRPIRDIAASDLLQVVRRIESRGATETARRVLGICGQVFRYAVSLGRAERDPSGDLHGMLPKKESAKAKHHASITDPKQVGELLRAIQGFQGSFVVKCALQLAPLVFVRPGELRGAEWREIDLEQAIWRIPDHRMKMKDTHIVPLSRQAVEIFRVIHPLTGEDKYVFPGLRSSSRPISENTVNAALRRLGYSKEEMTGHGFRSMASTLLHESGWPHDVIERQLAHAERSSVSAAYNYAQHLPERKKMMQAWADYLDSLASGAKVVPLFHKTA